MQNKKGTQAFQFSIKKPYQKQPKIMSSIDELQALKTNIIVNASLALKSKSSKQLMNYINKINEYVAELCCCLNISLQQVENKRVAKEAKVGGLPQTFWVINVCVRTLPMF